jgi:hypothetical protein
LWTTTWANGSLSLSANCGAHTYLGLHHLHGQEMGGRTAKGMGQAGLGWPTQVHPYAVRSPLRSRGSFSHFALFPPSITSFWQRHPRVQDRGSSRMKFGLLRFNPWGCSFVTLRCLLPLGVISSCTWTRTGLHIFSFELVVTLSF